MCKFKKSDVLNLISAYMLHHQVNTKWVCTEALMNKASTKVFPDSANFSQRWMKNKNMSWTNAFQIVHNPTHVHYLLYKWYSIVVSLSKMVLTIVSVLRQHTVIRKRPLQLDWFQILLRRPLDAFSIPVELTTVAVREQKGRKFQCAEALKYRRTWGVLSIPISAWSIAQLLLQSLTFILSSNNEQLIHWKDHSSPERWGETVLRAIQLSCYSPWAVKRHVVGIPLRLTLQVGADSCKNELDHVIDRSKYSISSALGSIQRGIELQLRLFLKRCQPTVQVHSPKVIYRENA